MKKKMRTLLLAHTAMYPKHTFGCLHSFELANSALPGTILECSS